MVDGRWAFWQMERKLFITMVLNIITHLKVPSKALIRYICFLPILTFCPDPSIFMGWISVPWLQPVDCVESVEVESVRLGASAGAARSILATCASNAMQMAFAYVALHSENIAQHFHCIIAHTTVSQLLHSANLMQNYLGGKSHPGLTYDTRDWYI